VTTAGIRRLTNSNEISRERGSVRVDVWVYFFQYNITEAGASILTERLGLLGIIYESALWTNLSLATSLTRRILGFSVFGRCIIHRVRGI